jgi:hypothetical protein
MGRTVRTVRDQINIEVSKWKPFRRQLKGKNRDRLDQVFNYAHTYADAGSMIVKPHTPGIVYMCALLGMLERIEELENAMT